jgi:hypothetical protein
MEKTMRQQRQHLLRPLVLGFLLALPGACSEESAVQGRDGNAPTADSGVTDTMPAAKGEAGAPDAKPGKPILAERPAVEGDWFPCLDDSCQRLEEQGYRFTGQGIASRVYASTEPHHGETYCYLGSSSFVGTFRWYAKEVWADFPDKQTTLKIPFVIQGDLAISQKPDQTIVRFKRLPLSQAKSPCKNQQPWVCPSQSGGWPSSGDSCLGRWHCDNGRFLVRCDLQGRPLGHLCFCYEGEDDTDPNKKERGRFYLEKECSAYDYLDFVKIVNKKCNFSL